MTRLCVQFQQSEPITLVKAKDDSVVGINLPNATLCVLLKNRMTQLRVNVNNFNFTHFSYSELDKAVLLSRVFNHLDYETTNNKVWKDIEQYINQWSHPNVIDEMQQNENFWNHLAKVLCDLMAVKLSVTDASNIGIDVDLCKFAESGTLPFTANSELMFCFRVPLDIITIKNAQSKESDYTFNKRSMLLSTIDNTGLNNVQYSQEIILQFQPLALRLYFPNFDDLMSVFLFFPEDPMSYAEMEGRKLLAQHKKPILSHRLEYPKTMNYMTATLVHFDLSISGKYKSLESNSECTNVYNETTCLVKCLEKEIEKVCGCKRFVFRHFLNRSDVRYCGSKDYKNCFNNYKLQRFNASNEKQECVKECHKCTKIIFQSHVSEKHIDWRSQTVDKKSTCDAYRQFLNTVEINCDHFWNNIETYLPFIMKGSKYGKETVEFLNRSFNPVYGLVKYKFKVKSFTYPEFSDRVSITNEEFKSQIGGIFGLYLGFSGMTFFALITKCIQLCKTRCRERRKMAEKPTVLSSIKYVLSLAEIPDMMVERKSVHSSPSQEAFVANVSKDIEDLQTTVVDLKASLSALSQEFGNFKSSDLTRDNHNVV